MEEGGAVFLFDCGNGSDELCPALPRAARLRAVLCRALRGLEPLSFECGLSCKRGPRAQLQRDFIGGRAGGILHDDFCDLPSLP